MDNLFLGSSDLNSESPRTAPEQDYNVDTQYYIDNVEIDTYIAINKKSHNKFPKLNLKLENP